MKKLSVLLAGLAVCCFAAPAFAAPVFPDVPEEHWARDAVANLAASGLVEGYPDGTFKGNRAATRYEMAMVIARFLAKNDQEHATFATKADLEELRRLVNQLKSELDALGVRVTNLEDSVASLDKRVTELERITFYGELDAIFTTQGFKSKEKWKQFNGNIWCDKVNNVPQQITGSILGSNIDVAQGFMPVINYKNGRPLTSGTGVSAVAKLGVNAKVSDDVDAGLELAAYTAVGDPIVNSFYGVQQPYMSNVFAGQGNYMRTTGVGNAMDMITAVTLDNFWVKHKPSGIKLTVGSFGEMDMDPILFAGQPNPNVNGTAYIPNQGIKINGSAKLFDDSSYSIDWELFYTSLPDSNLNGDYPNHVDLTANGAGYNTYAFGGDVTLKFKSGNFRVGYLRALNDGTNYTGYGIDHGIINNVSYWSNPMEYLYRTDVNTYPINYDTNVGRTYGPQETTNWSAHLDYTWEDVSFKPRFFVEYANSSYKVTGGADYTASGNALRAGLGATFCNDSLDVDIQYKSIDPDYDPMTLRYPVNIASMYRLPNFSCNPYMYQLHDSEIYTNNRQGWDFKLTYRFKDEKGKAWASYQTYKQVEASMYKTTENIGGDVYLGYNPGFIDNVFTRIVGYTRYHDILTDEITGIDCWDENKGKVKKFDIGVDYKFNNGLGIEAEYYKQDFKRNTNLSINQLLYSNYTATWVNAEASAAANYIDLGVTGFHIGVSYPFNEKFTGKIGYDYTAIKGHYDPNIVHANYALQTNSYDYTNIDTKQSVPYIGFDYKLSKNTEWSVNFQYFNTNDDAVVCVPYPAVGDVCAYNMDWKGTQLTTEFKVKF